MRDSAAPAPRAVESSCHEPFSEHLLRSRCRELLDSCDAYLPTFAHHLERSNREYRAAAPAASAALLQPPQPAATRPTAPSPESGPTQAPPAAIAPIATITVERVRLAYRLLPPTVRGAVFDVSA